MSSGTAIDAATNAVNTLTYSHHEVHEGNHFYVLYSVPSLGAMTTPDDMIQLHFATPDTTKWLHMIFHAKSGGAARFRITEAPSGGLATPTGTLTIFNKNRNSSNTSGLASVSYDGTAASGGTLLADEYVGEGRTGAGESRGAQEWILKQNTTYAVSLYDTTAITASIVLDWYEHTSIE